MRQFIMTEAECGNKRNTFGNHANLRYYHLSYRLPEDIYEDVEGDCRKLVIKAILEKDQDSEIFQPVNTTFLFSTTKSNVSNWFCYLKQRIKELIRDNTGLNINNVDFFLCISLITQDSTQDPIYHYTKMAPKADLNRECQRLVGEVKTELEI